MAVISGIEQVPNSLITQFSKFYTGNKVVTDIENRRKIYFQGNRIMKHTEVVLLQGCVSFVQLAHLYSRLLLLR